MVLVTISGATGSAPVEDYTVHGICGRKPVETITAAAEESCSYYRRSVFGRDFIPSSPTPQQKSHFMGSLSSSDGIYECFATSPSLRWLDNKGHITCRDSITSRPLDVTGKYKIILS